jgi:hypothetical protein
VVGWISYNETLVRVREIVLDFDVIDSWNKELETMNDGIWGEPSLYPYSFIELPGYMLIYFHLPGRQTECLFRAHANEKVPIIRDYSAIKASKHAGYQNQ